MTLKQLRYHLKGALAGLRLPVMSGPLRGARISAFCGMRFWRGTYDADSIDQFLAVLHPGDVVYDVGAHVGYYSLVAARQVGDAGRVYAFEPLPLNLRVLRGHVSANGVRNVEVVAAGVDEHSGRACFEPGPGTGRGRIGGSKGLEVELVSLDDWQRSSGARPPTLIKMDVEGAELRALLGARRIFAQYRPRLLLSVHTEALRRDCTELLESYGYHVAGSSRPGQIMATAG